MNQTPNRLNADYNFRQKDGGQKMPSLHTASGCCQSRFCARSPWMPGRKVSRCSVPETTPYPSQAISANGVTIPAGITKCQQISGGDGFATMGDGTQTYLFAFGPLSGMADIAKGLPGTMNRPTFMQDNMGRVDIVIGAPMPNYTFNGAVGLVPDLNADYERGRRGNLHSTVTSIRG